MASIVPCSLYHYLLLLLLLLATATMLLLAAATICTSLCRPNSSGKPWLVKVQVLLLLLPGKKGKHEHGQLSNKLDIFILNKIT